ncbi:MAG: hypothetical protein IK144_02550 [Bacteroidaceae bacterium]|nr:hypothetical protein [Bacteroidaceae bacterium]
MKVKAIEKKLKFTKDENDLRMALPTVMTFRTGCVLKYSAICCVICCVSIRLIILLWK